MEYGKSGEGLRIPMKGCVEELDNLAGINQLRKYRYIML